MWQQVFAINLEQTFGLSTAEWFDDGIANEVGSENVFEAHALTRELVERGCGVEHREPAAIGANGMGGVVVGHEPEDVGLTAAGSGAGRGDRRQRQPGEVPTGTGLYLRFLPFVGGEGGNNGLSPQGMVRLKSAG